MATAYSLGSTGGIQAMFSVNCSAALSPVSPGSFFALWWQQIFWGYLHSTCCCRPLQVFFHAVSSHWNDISLLPFTLKDSVQELLPLGRVPRSSGPSLMLPQHLAFLPPTALMIVKISDWVPTFPLGYHQLLQGSIMCYSSLHSQILAQCFVLCRCTISTCYTVI